MIAEYANRYKHLPPDDAPWHLVLGLLVRAGKFDTRDRLVVADGMLFGQPVGERDLGQRTLMDAKLRDIATLGEKV